MHTVEGYSFRISIFQPNFFGFRNKNKSCCLLSGDMKDTGQKGPVRTQPNSTS